MNFDAPYQLMKQIAEYPTEDWGLVGSTVVVGLVVVFIILVLLVFILYLMGFILAPRTPKAKEKVVETAPAAQPASTVTEEIEEEAGDDEELIAVISAAIAAYGEADGKQYRITSVKRRTDKTQRSNWSTAGIRENTRQF